jgi:hypothetical protein
MAKRKTSNKEAKPEITEKPKKSAPKAIDWDSMPEMVVIVFNGKEVSTLKSNAKFLVDNKRATLK